MQTFFINGIQSSGQKQSEWMAKSNDKVGRELKQENEDDNDYWIVYFVNAILRYIFLSVADWIDKSREKKKHIS